MYRKRKKRRYLITILSSIIIISGLLVFIFMKDNRKLFFIEDVTKSASTFINKMFYYPINYIKSNMKDYKDKKDLEDNYKKVKEKLQLAEEKNLIVSELENEIKSLKELLEIKNVMTDFSLVNATVISRNIGYWYNTFIIDKGYKDNISVGDAVVVKAGLIGEVINVSYNSSTIKMITGESSNNLSVKINTGDDYVYGLLTKYNIDTQEFIIDGISSNKEISIDSLVTTTGYGNNYPAGILIGKVVGIDSDNYGLKRYIRVKSDVIFDDLNYVSVLKKEVKE